MIDLNKLSLKSKTTKGAADTHSMLRQCTKAVTEAKKSYALYEYDACDPLATNSDEQNLEIFASKLAGIIQCVLAIAGNEGIDMEKAIIQAAQTED